MGKVSDKIVLSCSLTKVNITDLVVSLCHSQNAKDAIILTRHVKFNIQNRTEKNKRVYV